MFKYLFVILLVQGGALGLEGICTHESECRESRGTLFYSSDDLSHIEKLFSWGRTWTITPDKHGESTNIAVIFRDFTLTGSVYVQATLPGGVRSPWEYLSSEDGKLEYFALDAVSVKIYAPTFFTGEFVANYYAGCKFSIDKSESIEFSPVEGMNAATCWIVKPVMLPERKRIYFSLQNAHLTGGELVIKDLHSSTEVYKTIVDVEYDLFGADTNGAETILVELECESDLCDQNEFKLSYYAVSDEDVLCIEIQRECALNSSDMPTDLCQQSCPALDHIIDKEYRAQEMTNAVARTGSSSNIPFFRNGKCSHKLYCRCPLKKKYCFAKKKCANFLNNGCYHTCVFTKIVFCPRIRSLTVRLF